MSSLPRVINFSPACRSEKSLPDPSLMRKMGIEALYQRPCTTKPHPGHKVFPYLLRHRKITEPNQTWAMDITYIMMNKGFIYLAAVLDWATRRVLAWRLSNSMTADFCIDAVEAAIRDLGTPEIFNTDQGSQLPAKTLPACWKSIVFRTAWTGKAPGATTFLSNASGKASSMKKFICMPMTRWRMPGGAWGATSFFTTNADRIRRLTGSTPEPALTFTA